jgi:subtilisin family serine protease
MRRLALALLFLLSATAVADEKPRILVTFTDPGISNAARAGPARPSYSRRSSPYLVSVGVRRAADRVAHDFDLEVVDEWPIVPLKVHCLVFAVGDDRPLDDLLAELRNRPEVESAQPLNTFEVQGSRADPYANLQHNLDTLGLLEAHALSRGDGATVTIIDTGADFRHPELAKAIRSRHDFAGQGDFAGEAHGTAIAGIIGAASNNGVGIVGVAPEARLDVLRACWYPDGETGAVCDSFTLAKALSHALESGTGVINLSLGGPKDPLLARLAGLALRRGIVVVAAAPPQAGFPADVPGVIVVGSEDDGRNSRLSAPAIDILVPVPGGGFDYASGSSLAAAHATGVIALLIAARPGLDIDDVAGLLAGSRGKDGGSINACRALATMLGSKGCQNGKTAQQTRGSF